MELLWNYEKQKFDISDKENLDIFTLKDTDKSHGKKIKIAGYMSIDLAMKILKEEISHDLLIIPIQTILFEGIDGEQIGFRLEGTKVVMFICGVQGVYELEDLVENNAGSIIDNISDFFLHYDNVLRRDMDYIENQLSLEEDLPAERSIYKYKIDPRAFTAEEVSKLACTLFDKLPPALKSACISPTKLIKDYLENIE